MKTTPRDKVLMMILPALIILLFYGIFVARGRHTMLTKLTADVAKAHEKQPSQAQLQAQQRAAAETQRELYKLQTDMKTWDDRWHALAAPCLTHDRRSYRQSKLLTLLKEQNIHVKDHGPLDGSKDNRSNMKLSTVQDRLVKLMEDAAVSRSLTSGVCKSKGAIATLPGRCEFFPPPRGNSWPFRCRWSAMNPRPRGIFSHGRFWCGFEPMSCAMSTG